ncbi:MAG: DUF2384 domain-containing protein [Cyclobacteriaceae bacterium]
MKRNIYSLSEKLDAKAQEPAVGYHSVDFMSPTTLLSVLNNTSSNNIKEDLEFIKNNTSSSDQTIADWLNVNVKTYRNYREAGANLRPDIKEHLIILTALIKHGLAVFGSPEAFGSWLHTENFQLAKLKPAALLNTNSGVRLVDDRIAGIEFGDNA